MADDFDEDDEAAAKLEALLALVPDDEDAEDAEDAADDMPVPTRVDTALGADHALPGAVPAIAHRQVATSNTEGDDERTPADTLTSLAEAYRLDRELMDSYFPRIVETDRCRYCRQAWQQLANSRFDGHVRCAVSMPFQERIAAYFDAKPTTSYWSVATALGVTAATVKAWWANVKNPKQRIIRQLPEATELAKLLRKQRASRT